MIHKIIILVILTTVSLFANAFEAKSVLFVCTGNYYRSRMAEAFFNSLNKDANWISFSRGLDISKPKKNLVSPFVLEELSKRNVPASLISNNKPTLVTQADVNESEVIVLMYRKEHEPMFKNAFKVSPDKKILYWEIPDADIMTPKDAGNNIFKEVKNLILKVSTNGI